MVGYFLKGGLMMWPLLACSVIMLAIIIERFIYIFSVREDMTGLLSSLKELLTKKKIKEAAELCEKSRSPVAAVIAAGIKIKKVSAEEKEAVLSRIGTKQIRKLDKNLRGLGIIASISPLIGLLGTVMGLIKSFIRIQELGGRVDASILAGGIWEALITTAAGLSVAILAVIFYHYFEGVVDSYSSKMKDAAVFTDEWIKAGGMKISKDEAKILGEIENEL